MKEQKQQNPKDLTRTQMLLRESQDAERREGGTTRPLLRSPQAAHFEAFWAAAQQRPPVFPPQTNHNWEGKLDSTKIVFAASLEDR